MTYINLGTCGWVIDESEEPEPSWKREDEYQKKHETLLSDLKQAATGAALKDLDEIDWLVNALTMLMANVCRIAKKVHSDDA